MLTETTPISLTSSQFGPENSEFLADRELEGICSLVGRRGELLGC